MRYLRSSTHISLSSISLRPVGQAHDMRGLRSLIRGAGRHRCEQCPFTAWQWLIPSGWRYGWYTWITIGCCNWREREKLNIIPNIEKNLHSIFVWSWKWYQKSIEPKKKKIVGKYTVFFAGNWRVSDIILFLTKNI